MKRGGVKGEGGEGKEGERGGYSWCLSVSQSVSQSVAS